MLIDGSLHGKRPEVFIDAEKIEVTKTGNLKLKGVYQMERYRLALHPVHLEVEKDGELVKYKDHEMEVETLRGIIKDNDKDRKKLRRIIKQLEKKKEWLIDQLICARSKRYGHLHEKESEALVNDEMQQALKVK